MNMSACISLLRSASSQVSRTAVIASLRPVSSTLVRHQLMGTWIDRAKRWQPGVKTTGHESEEASAESDKKQSKDEEESVEKTNRVDVEKEELLRKCEDEIIQLKDKNLRALAETENTRNRMFRQVEDAKEFGIQNFAKDMLVVADLLEKACESVPQDQPQDGVNLTLASLADGLKLIQAEQQNSFKRHGLTRIDPKGEKFDPNYHESMFEVPGDKPGTIAVVTKVGYTLNGRTIRPAMVGVIKAQDPSSESSSSDDSVS